MSGVILFLLIVGIILALVPMDATIKNIIIALVLIFVVLSLFNGAGGYNHGIHFNW